jgi:hypothetical protein
VRSEGLEPGPSRGWNQSAEGKSHTLNVLSFAGITFLRFIGREGQRSDAGAQISQTISTG